MLLILVKKMLSPPLEVHGHSLLCCVQAVVPQIRKSANLSLFTFFLNLFLVGNKSPPFAEVPHSNTLQWHLTKLGSLAHWWVCREGSWWIVVRCELGGSKGGTSVAPAPPCLWRHPTPFRGKPSALPCPLAYCPASYHPPVLLLLVRKTAGSKLLTIY